MSLAIWRAFPPPSSEFDLMCKLRRWPKAQRWRSTRNDQPNQDLAHSFSQPGVDHQWMRNLLPASALLFVSFPAVAAAVLQPLPLLIIFNPEWLARLTFFDVFRSHDWVFGRSKCVKLLKSLLGKRPQDRALKWALAWALSGNGPSLVLWRSSFREIDTSDPQPPINGEQREERGRKEQKKKGAKRGGGRAAAKAERRDGDRCAQRWVAWQRTGISSRDTGGAKGETDSRRKQGTRKLQEGG